MTIAIWLTISQLTCTKAKRKTKALSMIGNASNAANDVGTFINITAEILCWLLFYNETLLPFRHFWPNSIKSPEACLERNMTSPSDNVDQLAIWDVVRNRSQSSRCVSLSSFSGSLDNSHSVEKNQSYQYNKTFVCCNAWCVTLRQKRNTPSQHIQYFYVKNN